MSSVRLNTSAYIIASQALIYADVLLSIGEAEEEALYFDEKKINSLPGLDVSEFNTLQRRNLPIGAKC